MSAADPRRPGLVLDHLVVCAETLEEGVAAVEAALGVALAPGGRHEAMGTHNRLLSLGPEDYLEVIAIDPEGRSPGRPRWFGLDGFQGPPRLAAWAARVVDLDAALEAAPEGVGEPMAFRRGALRWRMAVPEAGRLPLGGLHPALLEWRTPPPAPSLPNLGCRLARLMLTTAEPGALRAALGGLDDPRVAVGAGPPGLGAQIDTPGGRRRLP